MRSVFGIPIDALAVTLSVLVGLGIALIAALAVRNLVFFRLGVRNIGRRAGRSALIVVGLMLATAIIAAALGTGDTMGRTVRSGVLSTLGNSDEWITVKGTTPDVGERPRPPGTAGVQLFDERVVADSRPSGARQRSCRRCDAGNRPHGRRAGPDVAPDRAADQALRARPGSARRLRHDHRQQRPIRCSSATLRRARCSSTAMRRMHLGARQGDTIAVLVGGQVFPLRIADIVTLPGRRYRHVRDVAAAGARAASNRCRRQDRRDPRLEPGRRVGRCRAHRRSSPHARAARSIRSASKRSALKEDGLKAADKSGQRSS